MHGLGSAGVVVCEADETGQQCTEAFWRSVPLLDAATALQGAAPQGASLQGNWQGEEACSQHCHGIAQGANVYDEQHISLLSFIKL